MTDPLALAQDLIRCASVTPHDAGAMDVAQRALERLGFRVRRYRFGEVENLYARRGESGRNFCFAGHLDVVPPGEGWSVDPFAGEVRGELLIGRGAADMKTAVAAMISGAERYLASASPAGSISFLLTGDEEGPAVNGTKRVLAALAAEGEKLDHCLVGEPTSEDHVGDVIKNGRRGSLNVVITLQGKQGHVAYPRRALNPVAPLIDALHALKARTLDDGAPGFDPSNLEVTTVDVGNPAHNVIPARASAKLNIRFNTAHSSEDLLSWIESAVTSRAAQCGVRAEIAVGSRSEPFYTQPGPFTDLIVAAARESFALTPRLSTSGGTSDARYIKDYCPVAELGLRNASAHMVDEHVRVDDVRDLARCYEIVLRKYFDEMG
ncbi:MAG TPA: succinyl-diaminopimelate desuccinylase [Caulobacterales bacterium]|nr:succinyl-diaminopimelate desuccinylase [Caulobacterales bacterium]